MANDNNSRVARHGYEKSQKPSKSPKSPKPKKKRSKGTIFLKFIVGLFIVGCIGILAGMGLFWMYAKDAPTLDEKKLDSISSTVFYATNDEEIASLGTRLEKVAAADVPQQLEDAVVSVEDRRFYKHIGVDPIRIVGSALSNVTSGGLQGGSTLTQQLIKLSFFSTKSSDQTLKRKAQEAWMALQLEQRKSKQEIITYYINKVYMANGLYGMETASKAYFGKSLSELNLAQTALLAGMPQAPSAYDPYTQPEAAKQRRDIVLLTMKENDKITENEYNEAIKVPITEGLQDKTQNQSNWPLVDNYIREALAEVEEKTGKDPYSSGMKIYTNLDKNIQQRLYDIVNTQQYVQYPDGDMQVASTLVDTATGKVLAQIGGRNIPADTVLGQNLAVNTGRDFGSTVKPVTDYGPAFENLKYSTGKYIQDGPYKYKGTDISVNNWDNTYMGNITLRTALEQSRNVPAVKLFEEVGADKVAAFLKGLGIEYKSIEASNAISSNTADAGEKYGVSSEKLAAAYAAFANGGTYYKPQYVNKIVYQDGSTDEFQPEGTTAMNAGTAYMVTDILKDVITQGTGTNAQIPGLVQAGKTGTSNYTDDELAKLGVSGSVYPDITFSGYTPKYAMAVWTGYNKKMTPITEASTHVASDVYRNLMEFITSNSSDNGDWTIPDDLIKVGNELYFRDNYKQEVKPSSSYSKESSSSSKESSTSSSESESSSSSSSSSSSQEPTPSSSVDPGTGGSQSGDQGGNTGNNTGNGGQTGGNTPGGNGTGGNNTGNGGATGGGGNDAQGTGGDPADPVSQPT